MFDFAYQLKVLPDKPGVYQMKNSLGEVIYVGKAKILKNRVRQYFQNSKNHPEKVKKMVSNISEFEYIVTDSEIEALLLECTLIKKFKPKYNILLKDDKYYPFIKITVNEDYPRVFVTRKYIRDGSKYFGPYINVHAVNEVMYLIRRLFPVRTSTKPSKETREYIDANAGFQMHFCELPEDGFIYKDDYKKMIDEIIDILGGKNKKIVNEIKRDMEEASECLEFEKAATLRDRLKAIETISQKQKIITPQSGDEDYIDVYSDDRNTSIQIFFHREGKIFGREHFLIDNLATVSKGAIIHEFMLSFYGGTAQIPKNIYVSEIEDSELLEEFLSEKRGSKVHIKVPIKGEKKETLDMVATNAKVTLEQFRDKIIRDQESNEIALIQLQNILGLDMIPHRIEAYDISNIQGVDSVGTMVVFEEGKSKNSDYRRFKIKTVYGPNDYDSMREVLSRRFERGLIEIKNIKDEELHYSKGKFCLFPDIIMMDGGKGQVNVAIDVLKEFNIDIPVCGLVKDDNHRTRGIIYNGEEISVGRTSKLMHMITRIQDEVHRYAISYHRSLRDKTTFNSVLDEIPKIGPKRRRELLIKFGSIEKIKDATLEELLETPSIDKIAGVNIMKFFSSVKKQENK
ncbi:MAG: excinuclease ABC subunit UvrC [Sarcina sp.]